MPSLSEVITIQSLPTILATGSPYDFVAQVFCDRFVRDRFNVLNQYSSINWGSTVDAIPSGSVKSISDIMDERAVELISKGSIAAQWSGGVDSTALLLALIKNGISKEDLVICYDSNSIEEYPKLYNWLKENGWNLKECSNWYKELSTIDTNLITNGWCADQLFGSVFFYSAPEYYSYSIPDFLSKATLTYGKLTEDQITEHTEVYQKYAKNVFNLDLNIAAELGWFINFVMKWTWVSKYNDLWLLLTKNRNKTQVFYNTLDFQSWSLNNFDTIKSHNIYGEDHRYYKKPLKDYCNSIFPDDDFLDNKSKQPSWNSERNESMYASGKIVVESTSGYEVHNIEKATTAGKWQELINQIFTSVKK